MIITALSLIAKFRYLMTSEVSESLSNRMVDIFGCLEYSLAASSLSFTAVYSIFRTSLIHPKKSRPQLSALIHFLLKFFKFEILYLVFHRCKRRAKSCVLSFEYHHLQTTPTSRSRSMMASDAHLILHQSITGTPNPTHLVPNAECISRVRSSPPHPPPACSQDA